MYVIRDNNHLWFFFLYYKKGFLSRKWLFKLMCILTHFDEENIISVEYNWIIPMEIFFLRNDTQHEHWEARISDMTRE